MMICLEVHPLLSKYQSDGKYLTACSKSIKELTPFGTR